MRPLLVDFTFFKVYSFPLLMGIAWAFGLQLFFHLIQFYQGMSQDKEKVEIKINAFQAKIFCLGLFISSWIGAKIFFIFSSTQGEYTRTLYSGQFWYGGGFVFYGGLLFALIFTLIYSLKYKYFPPELLFLTIPPLCIAHGVGRVGCFLAGCCFGVETNIFLGVHLHGAVRHPVQLYEALILFILGLGLLKKIKTSLMVPAYSLRKINSLVLSTYFLSYTFFRFFCEFLRGDLMRGLYVHNLSTSQIISFILFFSCALFKFYVLVASHRGIKD